MCYCNVHVTRKKIVIRGQNTNSNWVSGVCFELLQYEFKEIVELIVYSWLATTVKTSHNSRPLGEQHESIPLSFPWYHAISQAITKRHLWSAVITCLLYVHGIKYKLLRGGISEHVQKRLADYTLNLFTYILLLSFQSKGTNIWMRVNAQSKIIIIYTFSMLVFLPLLVLTL